MTIRLNQLRVKLDHDEGDLTRCAARVLGMREEDILRVRIVKKSVDARDKADVHFSYALDIDTPASPRTLPRGAVVVAPEPMHVCPVPRAMEKRPLVVGLGPAGLSAALTLARMGLRPLVIERGRPVETRAKNVDDFWRTGRLDPVSNVQFGEGGAGAFSDGKLTTGIKDPRCRDVLYALCEAGAPEEILYAAKPHIGTDRLRSVVRNLREKIISLGGEVVFECRLTELLVASERVVGARIEKDGCMQEIDVDEVILAVGHSARDTFEMLNNLGVRMTQKPFSIGARIEHRQRIIDEAQYGKFAGHKALGAADYKLSARMQDGRGVYTFCMCPGGYVVAAASEKGGVVTNGMSYHARAGENANAALLVSVGPGDFGADDPLAGMRFQRTWEEAAFRCGGGDNKAPAQLVGDFLARTASRGAGGVLPTYGPGVNWASLDECLPAFATDAMRRALPIFGRKIRGYDARDAVLTGVETRSSSPVRIERDDFCLSSLSGLYPCGEGAGYAGGILSAAVDGIRCAEALGKR